MKHLWVQSLCLSLLAGVLGGALVTAQPADITTPPAAVVEKLKLSPFYKKHVDVEGFSIVSSEKVPDAALYEAAWLVNRMVGHRPDILKALAENKARFAIMAHDEFTTTMPEHSDMKPAPYWDKRARGLGATPLRPAVSCGAENLLCYPGDPYQRENICVHEFGHAIHQMGLNTVDPTFDTRLAATYESAMNAGLWKDTYAASNKNEYWAEGVQDWFDTNRENDNQHNHINTRDQLKTYDSGLAALLKEVFGDKPWRYQRIADRLPEDRAHLRGWDVATAPKFEWPKALVEWQEKNRQPLMSSREYAAVRLVPMKAAQAPASLNGSEKTMLHFFNTRRSAVKLWWVDTKGTRKPYGSVAPSGDSMQQTYAGHCWLVTDETGNPVGHCVALQKSGKVIIE
ncbi:hypothetical protein [Roseimicrobium sp. ORNL1]|uniref:VHL beta domain-containing protein n=1 Tax=Roseimicrobium sp. ORNL1 TaxID=2711231 RepID=UPI0013E1161A|nr:hypothetical protein [Roseimicrobium sp. ORNL1]QIF01280.1 hypothetical protein G5S37_07020 [Roseimicrobium sp. ORNL1]